MKNYTIIWIDSWMTGSNHFSITRKKFIRAESPKNIMESPYGDAVQYIFEGFIPTLGEEILEEEVENLA